MNKTARVLLEYAGLVGLPVAGVLLALQLGSSLQAPATSAVSVLRAGSAGGGLDLPLLLLSVAVLVACARLAGVAARWIGQPQVVGPVAPATPDQHDMAFPTEARHGGCRSQLH